MANVKIRLAQLEKLVLSVPLRTAIINAIDAIKTRGDDPVKVFEAIANESAYSMPMFSNLSDEELDALIADD